MLTLSDEDYTAQSTGRRYRPSKRVATSQSAAPATLTEDFIGLAVAYGNTLLFIGYEVKGAVEIVIYPRYRFSSDDRVQGYLGYLWVPLGTSWERILADVERIHGEAQDNYRFAVGHRSSETRAHGSRFETAYDTVTEVFRESWHGFELRLGREGSFVKQGIKFSGSGEGPILAELQGKVYTVNVFPTGSITMVAGDRRDLFR